MSDAEFQRRKHLSFLQAEGIAALPQQMGMRQVNAGFRTALFSKFYNSHTYNRGNYSGPLISVLRGYWLNELHKFEDEFTAAPGWCQKLLGSIVKTGKDSVVLSFYQYALRHTGSAYSTIYPGLAQLCELHRLAYRVVGGPLEPTLVPISSEQDAAAVTSSFEMLAKAKQGGAVAHLRKAAEALTAGDWAQSARESIAAVESAACAISGETTRDLNAALSTLEKNNMLHPALKAAISKLYGYTSSERGIRHSLIEDNNIRVDENLALFLFGACSACASYLVRMGSTKI